MTAISGKKSQTTNLEYERMRSDKSNDTHKNDLSAHNWDSAYKETDMQSNTVKNIQDSIW